MKKKARIISYNLESEAICASAARISTQNGNAEILFESAKGNKKNESLIMKVLASGHQSIIEHAVFTIAFTNVSVLVEQFFIEARLASFTVKSRRYVNFGESGFYVPDLSMELREKYIACVEELFLSYNELIKLNIPKEDARFVLPYCFYSNFYCTVNARELLYLLEQMICGRGSYLPEIKMLGEQLLTQLTDTFPWLEGVCRFNGKKGYQYCFPKRNLVFQEVFPETELVQSSENLIDRVIDGYCVRKGVDEVNSREDVLNYIMHNKRARELEQVVFTIKIHNISLSALTHIERHRMQSLIIPEMSSIRCSNFILPDTISQNPNTKSIYLRAIKKAFDLRKKFIETNNRMQVYLLISGNTTDVMTTMNARELRTFFLLRCCNRAQWEIREIANSILNLCQKVEPDFFKYMGPSCALFGYCTEGRMTCGKPYEKIR